MSASIIQPLYLSCCASVFLEHCPQVAVEQTCCITPTPPTSVLSFCITPTPATYKCIIPDSELSPAALGLACLTDSPSVAQTMQLLRAPSHFGPSYVDRCCAVPSSVIYLHTLLTYSHTYILCKSTHSWYKCSKPLRAIVCRQVLFSTLCIHRNTRCH